MPEDNDVQKWCRHNVRNSSDMFICEALMSGLEPVFPVTKLSCYYRYLESTLEVLAHCAELLKNPP